MINTKAANYEPAPLIEPGHTLSSISDKIGNVVLSSDTPLAVREDRRRSTHAVTSFGGMRSPKPAEPTPTTGGGTANSTAPSSKPSP